MDLNIILKDPNSLDKGELTMKPIKILLDDNTFEEFKLSCKLANIDRRSLLRTFVKDFIRRDPTMAKFNQGG